MYTTTKATREQALKAVAAAQRAMERHMCSKSQFKFKCFSCGEMIHRGDKITRCIKADAGMTLRYRGAGGECGLTMAETAFYQAETGKDMWVHIGCIPCYWDSLPEDCNEYSRPKLRPIPTDWGVKVYGEWDKLAADDEAWERMGVPYFCMVKGYPMEKFMRDRIIHAVTRFQAIWRGYIYKKAYLIALQQQRRRQRRIKTPTNPKTLHLVPRQVSHAATQVSNKKKYPFTPLYTPALFLLKKNIEQFFEY